MVALNLEEFIRETSRPASAGSLYAVRQDDDPSASFFGKVCLSRSDESWPMTGDIPWWPIIQINCGELPARPEILRDVAIITCFVPPDGRLSEYGDPNGTSWLLRAYPTVEELEPLDDPPTPQPYRYRSFLGLIPRSQSPPIAYRIRWELVTNDLPDPFDDAVRIPAQIEREYAEGFHAVETTKVGGWPTLVQPGRYWDPEVYAFAFQIGSHPNANWAWADSGVAHVIRSRSNPEDWRLSWQTY